MRIPRIFYPFKEEENNSIILNITASHHLKVINIKEGQNVELFNGSGYFFNAKVTEQNKKNITLKRTSDVNFQKKQIPSINIAVADIRSFDKVIREVCQSGIDSITSVKTKKTKFSKLSSEKKIMRWQSIAFNSCEQSGLNWVPKIYSSSLQEWTSSSKSKSKIFLDPKAENNIQKVELFSSIDFVVGPEGGFSEEEKIFFKKNNFIGISCGNLTFRTETMPIVALSMIKALYGVNK
ncbi:16S rRNA (uracil(1498)-N(3))-methyltransferase [SAR86 cluster bacterium]|nr:16S rRNA (uracil(1498)-N(3))-methyltransferase [SAR86 cluster bacterium]